MVMVSGYWVAALYADRLRHWHSIRFQAMTHGGPRTEWLWSNFAEPVALHDYRHLGAGFRERERIKRKKQRWTARLHRLPMLERQALLAAIDDAWWAPPSKTAMHTAEGRSRAQKRGQRMGRKPKLTEAQQDEARRRAEGATLAELARSYGVGKSAISRLTG
jgi:hypothetical protein